MEGDSRWRGGVVTLMELPGGWIDLNETGAIKMPPDAKPYVMDANGNWRELPPLDVADFDYPAETQHRAIFCGHYNGKPKYRAGEPIRSNPVVAVKQPLLNWRKAMSIIHTVLGCLLGVIFYMLLALVTPVASWGPYSVGIEVAMCLIGVAVIESFPFWPKVQS